MTLLEEFALGCFWTVFDICPPTRPSRRRHHAKKTGDMWGLQTFRAFSFGPENGKEAKAPLGQPLRECLDGGKVLRGDKPHPADQVQYLDG